MKFSPFIRRAAVAAVVTMSVAAGLPAQDAAKDVRKLEEQWATLVIKKDGAGLGKLVTDDYLGGGADGKFYDKANLIKETNADPTPYVSYTYSNVKIRTHGNTVIMSAISNVTTKGEKGNVVTRYAWTDVWIKQADGRWLCAGGHASPAP